MVFARVVTVVFARVVMVVFARGVSLVEVCSIVIIINSISNISTNNSIAVGNIVLL